MQDDKAGPGGPREAGGAEPEERSAGKSNWGPQGAERLGENYSVAEAEADLAAYRALKKSASALSLVIAAAVALLAYHWLPVPALALAAGGVCGVVNTLLTTVTTERLLDSRNVGLFVLSSFLRIGLFGIVPVAFAAHGPWWSMAWYFAGFFLPLAMFAIGARRAFERK